MWGKVKIISVRSYDLIDWMQMGHLKTSVHKFCLAGLIFLREINVELCHLYRSDVLISFLHLVVFEYPGDIPLSGYTIESLRIVTYKTTQCLGRLIPGPKHELIMFKLQVTNGAQGNSSSSRATIARHPHCTNKTLSPLMLFDINEEKCKENWSMCSLIYKYNANINISTHTDDAQICHQSRKLGWASAWHSDESGWRGSALALSSASFVSV